MATARLVPVLALVLALSPSGIADRFAGDDFAWSFDSTPRAAGAQGIGGNAAILVASPFAGSALASRDGGGTWSSIPGFPGVAKGRVAFDPADARVGYVAGFGGVARTLDGGASWDLALAVARAARIDVGPDGRVLVGARLADGSNRVVVSEDRGASWRDLGAPLPANVPLCGVAFGRSPSEVLAMTNEKSWFSHDGGATWTETPGAGFEFGIEDTGVVWRSDLDVLERTRDGGASWESVDVPGFGTAIAPHPAGGVVVATTAGLLRVKADLSVEDLGGDAAMMSVEALAVDPRDADAVLVAHSSLGLARVRAGAFEGFDVRAFPPARLHAVASDATGRVLAAAGALGVWVSRDAGASWSHAGAGLSAPALRVSLARDGSALFVGAASALGAPAVESSTDAGRTFVLTQLPTLDGGRVTDVQASVHAPLVAFVAVESDGALHEVLRTSDGGQSWERVLASPAIVRDLAWEPATGSLLAATSAGALAFDGVAWTPRGAPGNASAIAIGTAGLFAATSEAVWRDAPFPPALAPWAPAPQRPVARAAVDGDAAWLALEGGAMVRCAGAALAGVCGSAGALARDVAVAPGRVLVATGAGLGTLWQ